MSGAYTYVEGADLVGLILEVRDEFLARLPYELDEARRPNSIRLVAIDVFTGKSTDEQLAVMRDLLDANAGLTVRNSGREVFPYAESPADYMKDLVCQVVYQILTRDPAFQSEDDRRIAASVESVEELEADRHARQADEGPP
jgi:hypothetical protein